MQLYSYQIYLKAGMIFKRLKLALDKNVQW